MSCAPIPRRQRSRGVLQRGAGLVEFVVIAPTLLAMTLAMLQTGLAFHARSSLTYASFEAARAGTLSHANPVAMRDAFARAMTPYYGGGRDAAELARAAATAQADLSQALRIEILSPSRESFADYHSPAAARQLGATARVIPSANLGYLNCPADRPDCNADSASNRSGQSLADANLLKLRITWGLPPAKQVPMAGRFFTWAVRTLDPAHPDVFRRSLLQAGRIPLVTQVTLRMQSDAVENAAVLSMPRNGNGDAVPDAGPGTGPGGAPEPAPLPDCPLWDPLCTPATPDAGPPTAQPSPGADGTPPPQAGDLDPDC
ncbi:TadE family protein [Thauera sp.]|uniref:TadE family protein n=1 Tax=Thauera sp. TaxID=1905334 RepID=UPI002B64E046|nr:TadE family protein [Thauera sp.]HRP26445.1 pilus assembly protein [Thauera sp.]